MKKIERVLATIILLLDRETITASELAKYFNVSKRTISRDIETIEQAGFPIITKLGRSGGIAIMDSFKLRVLTFTKEEKNLILDALIIKEKLVGNSFDPNVIKEKINILTDKSLSTNGNYISINSPTVHRPIVEKYIQEVSRKIEFAIKNKIKVAIDYIDGDGKKTSRIVYPHELGLFNGSWFMQAFCETRQSFRFFKLTRIRDIKHLSEAFKFQSSYKIEWPILKKEVIRLEFEKNTLGKIYDYYVEDEIQVLHDKVIVTFLSHRINEVAAYLLSFGDNVTILEPKNLLIEHQKLISDLKKI